MIPKELDDLIKEYLTDGIISEKERQVLLKKAQKMGLDPDEIDLYIDAQQQKTDQEIDAAAKKKRGQSCPFCGGSLPMLTDKCPHCGETVTPEANENFEEIFKNLENALVDLKDSSSFSRNRNNAKVEMYIRKAKLYYGNNPKIQMLISEIEKDAKTAKSQAKSRARKETISDFFSFENEAFRFIFGFSLLAIIAIGCIKLSKCGNNKENNSTDVDSSKTTEQTITKEQIQSDASLTSKYALEAIEKGQLNNAYSYIDNYTGDKKEIMPVIIELTSAYIEKGYDYKLSNLEKYNVNHVIIEKYLQKGEYVKACKYFDPEQKQEFYDFLCQCIDGMKKEKNEDSNIKSFIDKQTNKFYSLEGEDSEWHPKKVQKSLYKYADLGFFTTFFD